MTLEGRLVVHLEILDMTYMMSGRHLVTSQVSSPTILCASRTFSTVFSASSSPSLSKLPSSFDMGIFFNPHFSLSIPMFFCKRSKV